MARVLARLALVLVLAQAAIAHAIQIAIVPSSASFSPGDTIQVDVVVSGLGNFSAPSIGAFDISIGFNEALIDSTGVDFCVNSLCPLGDPGLLQALTDVQLSFGQVNLAEVSLLPPPTLDGLQPSSFVLARLGFFANAAGASDFTLLSARIDDAFGNKLPEPRTVWLLMAALGAWATSLKSRVPADPRARRVSSTVQL